MPSETPIFTVVQSKGRTTVAFCDWSSFRDAIFSHAQPEVVDNVKTELSASVSENNSAVLAINMSEATSVPSSFFGILLGLHNRGLEIELLHPTDGVRQILERTRLDQVFVVGE